jgi:hypothetical protein
MNAKRKALLDTLASDPFNGESAEALALSGHAATAPGRKRLAKQPERRGL